MRRLGFLSVCVLAAAGVPGGDAPLRIAMYSGSAEYKSAETLPAFKKHLEERYNVACTVYDAAAIDNLPGLDDLATCDVAVFFTRRLKLSDEQIAKVKKYCEAGKPIVGIRTASHGFQTWLEMDKLVLGGDYKQHAGVKKAEVAIVDAAKEHVVLAGVKPFTTMGSLYYNRDIAADVTVLLKGSTGDNTQPVAWVREQKGGRVFYTSLGTPDDFKDESFLRLLTNAVFWTAKKTPAAK
jgi:type 1 glutamine amidotransferase